MFATKIHITKNVYSIFTIDFIHGSQWSALRFKPLKKSRQSRRRREKALTGKLQRGADQAAVGSQGGRNGRRGTLAPRISISPGNLGCIMLHQNMRNLENTIWNDLNNPRQSLYSCLPEVGWCILDRDGSFLPLCRPQHSFATLKPACQVVKWNFSQSVWSKFSGRDVPPALFEKASARSVFEKERDEQIFGA